MAAGLHGNMAIYNAEFNAGVIEGLTQNVNVFNQASAGAITLSAGVLRGYYNKNSFFANIASVTTRRDLTSASAATDLAIAQAEKIGVKLYRRFGPAAVAIGALRTQGLTDAELAYIMGQKYADEKLKAYANAGLSAVETSLQGQAALVKDVTGESTKTLTHTYLAQVMAKLGDKAQEIVCFVMHSKPYFDLVGQAISDKIDSVAGAVIYGATAPTLGRPVVVIDAPALTDANGSLTDTYNVLGLKAGALIVTESETEDVFADIVSGLDNLIWRMQAEFAFNVEVMGFKWDTTNGGANPTDGALATTTNWDLSASDVKLCAGVRLVCQ